MFPAPFRTCLSLTQRVTSPQTAAHRLSSPQSQRQGGPQNPASASYSFPVSSCNRPLRLVDSSCYGSGHPSLSSRFLSSGLRSYLLTSTSWRFETCLWVCLSPCKFSGSRVRTRQAELLCLLFEAWGDGQRLFPVSYPPPSFP